MKVGKGLMYSTCTVKCIIAYVPVYSAVEISLS